MYIYMYTHTYKPIYTHLWGLDAFGMWEVMSNHNINNFNTISQSKYYLLTFYI